MATFLGFEIEFKLSCLLQLHPSDANMCSRQPVLASVPAASVFIYHAVLNGKENNKSLDVIIGNGK